MKLLATLKKKYLKKEKKERFLRLLYFYDYFGNATVNSYECEYRTPRQTEFTNPEIPFPFFNFDWNPAKEPYDIRG